MYNHYFLYEPFVEFMHESIKAKMEFIRDTKPEFSADLTPDQLLSMRGVEMRGGTAIVPLEGVIVKDDSPWNELFGMTSTDAFAETMSILAEKEEVTDVEIWVNSPGGDVIGTRNAFEAVKDFPKPTTAISEGLMASAAYYIASGADKIYASDDAMVGSIGVLSTMVSVKDMYDQMGVDINVIRATGSELKALGTPYEKHDETAIEQNRKLSNVYREQFVNAIQSNGRTIDPEALTGEVFVGEDAVILGLVDGTTKEYKAMKTEKDSLETVEAPAPVASEEVETLDFDAEPDHVIAYSLSGWAGEDVITTTGYSSVHSGHNDYGSFDSFELTLTDGPNVSTFTLLPEKEEPQISEEVAKEFLAQYVNKGILPSKLLDEKVSIVQRVGLEVAGELLAGITPTIPGPEFITDKLAPEPEGQEDPEKVVTVRSEKTKKMLMELYAKNGVEKTVKLIKQ